MNGAIQVIFCKRQTVLEITLHVEERPHPTATTCEWCWLNNETRLKSSLFNISFYSPLRILLSDSLCYTGPVEPSTERSPYIHCLCYTRECLNHLWGGFVSIFICPTFSFSRLNYPIQIWGYVLLHSAARSDPAPGFFWRSFIKFECNVKTSTMPHHMQHPFTARHS